MKVSRFTSPSCHVFYPENPLPLVLDSPHSGGDYPPDFNHTCSWHDLRGAEDSCVDEIFADAPTLGAPLLCARFPRSYLDVNREITDIDPLLLSAPWQGATAPSMRSAAGFGLVRRLIRAGVPIYANTLSQKDIQTRIDRYYLPYHTMLSTLLDAAHPFSGQVWHLNLHSMPPPETGSKTPDIVLGDRDGTSCGRDFLHMVRGCLTRMGYRVAINDPYKGVEILRRYGAPHAGRHSLQIEISKHLYINEKTHEKTDGFLPLKDHMTDMIRQCIDYVLGQALPLAAD